MRAHRGARPSSSDDGCAQSICSSVISPFHVVAGAPGVDRRSVRRWKRAYRGLGRAGLRARPASGRPSKLTARSDGSWPRLVVVGPEAAATPPASGRADGSSTSSANHFKVAYHPITSDDCWRACGFSPQRPSRARRSATIAGSRLDPSGLGPVKKTRAPRRPPDLPG